MSWPRQQWAACRPWAQVAKQSPPLHQGDMVTIHHMPDLTDAILLVILCTTGHSQSAMLTWAANVPAACAAYYLQHSLPQERGHVHTRL